MVISQKPEIHSEVLSLSAIVHLDLCYPAVDQLQQTSQNTRRNSYLQHHHRQSKCWLYNLHLLQTINVHDLEIQHDQNLLEEETQYSGYNQGTVIPKWNRKSVLGCWAHQQLNSSKSNVQVFLCWQFTFVWLFSGREYVSWPGVSARWYEGDHHGLHAYSTTR